ncbi:MAG TPA: glycosyltransferase family 4 protein [Pyrinomonadaceae bacterium]|nr:glycosyltransferase family 4 protein [Pyrinomonadaceae bacterium]
MKILLAYEWCLIGGVEAFMASLSSVLRAEGHQCEFFFFTRGPMEKELPSGSVAHFGDLADLLRLVRSRGFDIVHANSSDWRNGITAVREVGAKLVITAHGMVVPGWNSTNCDAFVCCSAWQALEQKAYTDLPIHTVLNGIDTTKFKPSEPATLSSTPSSTSSEPIVAWVGRGTDMVHKRIDKFAAVAPALHRAGLRIRLADPYGPDEVEKVVPGAARALRPVAEFWGAVSKDKLPAFFQGVADSGGCVLSTSISEGLPMALLEAQACGCPVIGTNVRGVNEVVVRESGGVLYPFETAPEELASLVLDTLRDTEGMRSRREACARLALEKFSLERMAGDYLRIYREALDARRRRSLGLRVGLWCAPLLHWSDYIERRWTAGNCHYEASRKLAQAGEGELARATARLSLVTCPSLYMRPERLAHLLKTLLRPGALPRGQEVTK